MASSLLVVDVQPAYASSCEFIVRNVAQRINNTRKPTCIMWVGESFTDDTQADVRDYLWRNGARPSKLDQCQFIEKDYGFFRSWMGNVNDADIIKVGQEMIRCGITDTREMDLTTMMGDDFDGTDPLLLPSFSDSHLKWFDAFDTCGGGSDACLAEIELYISMLGKKFNRLDSLVY